MLPHKRKQSTASHSSKSRQVKLTHLFAAKERCPHCTAQFDTLELLIEHAEAKHFTHHPPASADVQDADAAAAFKPDPQPSLTPEQPAGQQSMQMQHQSQPTANPHVQPWWRKAAPEDPVVAHIRYSSTAGSQTPQPVRLSVLSSIAPVELVLQALPGALASRLLTELLAESASWVAGSWWFGGQQQTAPRSSATFTLEEPQVSTGPPVTSPAGSTQPGDAMDSLTAAAPCQHLDSPAHHKQPLGSPLGLPLGINQQLDTAVPQQQSASAQRPHPHTAPQDQEQDQHPHQQQWLQQQQQQQQQQGLLQQQQHQQLSQQQQQQQQQVLLQQQQQQQQHQQLSQGGPTGPPSSQVPKQAAAAAAQGQAAAAAAQGQAAAAAAAAQGQAAAAAPDLSSSVPQLPAPTSLQQAAVLISTAVNTRSSTPQQQHWQQQREALTAQLTAAAAAARGAERAAYAVVVATSSSRRVPVVQCAPAPSAAAAETADQQGAGRSVTLEHTAVLPQQQQQQQQQLDRQASAPVLVGAQKAVWRPSYVLANLYRDGQQSVGSHSDRLSSLGPLPTIASVSLGAARLFRLHPADKAVAAAAAAAAQGGASSSVRLVSSIDIHLPHNSLLIMWPPTQEEWKHEVPKTKSVTSHPLSGPTRINLTFRQLQPDWSAAVPACRCGRPAIMRCGLQHSSFVYYYACDNTRGPGCGLYQVAVVLDSKGRTQQQVA